MHNLINGVSFIRSSISKYLWSQFLFYAHAFQKVSNFQVAQNFKRAPGVLKFSSTLNVLNVRSSRVAYTQYDLPLASYCEPSESWPTTRDMQPTSQDTWYAILLKGICQISNGIIGTTLSFLNEVPYKLQLFLMRNNVFKFSWYEFPFLLGRFFFLKLFFFCLPSFFELWCDV